MFAVTVPKLADVEVNVPIFPVVAKIFTKLAVVETKLVIEPVFAVKNPNVAFAEVTVLITATGVCIE